MATQDFLSEIKKRRTFAIISHPDAGKTTITEKVLLYGHAIQRAGTVKGRGANGSFAKSDWMEMEKERGISVTTSVMQFPYNDCLVNLLDTPGHEDFSEDTYRVLTAVDSCLMVIDAAKGVEERTRKLMEVTRMRTTPKKNYLSFVLLLPGQLVVAKTSRVFTISIPMKLSFINQVKVLLFKISA